MKRIVWLGAIVLTLALAGSRFAAAQQTGQQGGSTPTISHPASHLPGDDANSLGIPPATQEKMAESRAVERQRLLVADTDKLLELATALKADVAKTDKNMLSLDVVKRAEQIEKLARTVKEREKGQR